MTLIEMRNSSEELLHTFLVLCFGFIKFDHSISVLNVGQAMDICRNLALYKAECQAHPARTLYTMMNL